MALIRANTSGGGSGASGTWKFVDDFTNLEVVSVCNPNGQGTRTIIFNNIPKTTNVIYASVSKSYSQGVYTVGDKVNVTTANVMFVDDIGSILAFSSVYRNSTISGTTLTTGDSGNYTNYGLVIIGEYIP